MVDLRQDITANVQLTLCQELKEPLHEFFRVNEELRFLAILSDMAAEDHAYQRYSSFNRRYDASIKDAQEIFKIPAHFKSYTQVRQYLKEHLPDLVALFSAVTQTNPLVIPVSSLFYSPAPMHHDKDPESVPCVLGLKRTDPFLKADPAYLDDFLVKDPKQSTIAKSVKRFCGDLEFSSLYPGPKKTLFICVYPSLEHALHSTSIYIEDVRNVA